MADALGRYGSDAWLVDARELDRDRLDDMEDRPGRTIGREYRLNFARLEIPHISCERRPFLAGGQGGEVRFPLMMPPIDPAAPARNRCDGPRRRRAVRRRDAN